MKESIMTNNMFITLNKNNSKVFIICIKIIKRIQIFINKVIVKNTQMNVI